MKSPQLAKTQQPFTKLKGRIEIDETFIKEIQKGNFKDPIMEMKISTLQTNSLSKI